jgi:hypothetical protein
MAAKHNSRDPIGLTIYRSSIESVLGKNFFEHRLTPTEITSLLRESLCPYAQYLVPMIKNIPSSI